MLLWYQTLPTHTQETRETHGNRNLNQKDLLFELASADNAVLGLLKLLLQELVHGEGHGLTGSDTHHTRRDTLVESASTLLLEHLGSNGRDTGQGRLAGLGLGLLQTSLDRVNRSVREGTHSTGDETDHGGLVRGQLLVGELRLGSLEESLQFRVGSEVGGLVGTLAQSSQGDTTVESAESFFPDNGEQSVRGTSVLGGIERVGERVVLSL